MCSNILSVFLRFLNVMAIGVSRHGWTFWNWIVSHFTVQSVKLLHRFYIPLTLNLQNDIKLVWTLCHNVNSHIVRTINDYNTELFSSISSMTSSFFDTGSRNDTTNYPKYCSGAPKWAPQGSKIEPKWRSRPKRQDIRSDLLFTMFHPHRAPPK